MADNLVTSIRRMVGTTTRSGQRTLLEHAAMQAADEIERLRAAGDALAERLRWWTDDTDEAYPDHRVLQTWEEIRHG